MQSISPTAPIGLGTGRHALAAALGLAATGARLCARHPSPSVSACHALLLEPYGLGDALSLVPLTRALLHHGWRVTVCARAPWRDAFPADVRWVDCRLPWTAYDDSQKYRLGSLFGPEMRSFLRQLRSAAAGAVGVDTRGDVRSHLLLWLADCRRVLTLDRYLGYDLANRPWSAETIPFDSSLRRWQSNLRFLSALCPEADPAAFPLDLRSQWPDVPTPGNAQTIGLIPLAPWQGKWWPSDCWGQTIDRLRAGGWVVRGLAGPGQQSATAEALGMPVDAVTVCSDLRAWAHALASLNALITVDTGPMHLADALHVPLVALYGAGTLPLWAPTSPHSIALHRQLDPDYAPVHPTGAGIARGQELMRRHSPESVLAALSSVTTPAPAHPD